jgi:MFS transporter, YNFM family, putative membrane transport protein
LTFGFFGGHSTASSWVGRLATHDRAQASSLYLFFYYVGSSIGGTAAGTFWTAFGWVGVVGMVICFLVLALILSFCLSASSSPDRLNIPS